MNTNPRTNLLAEPLDPSKWESAMQAFLAEKYRRTGSMRTAQSYSRILSAFFGQLRKTPDQVITSETMAFCFGRGVSGKEPAALTVGSRIAAISSFYRFLIRMDLLTSNPCERLERPKHTPSPARGLSGEDVKRLLAVIPDDMGGRRDRAIILTLVLTGRRRSEVLNLKVGDIEWEGERAYYSYRGKGGKQGRRELPRPAFDAIRRTLTDLGKPWRPWHRTSRSGRLPLGPKVCPSLWLTLVSSGIWRRRDYQRVASTCSAIQRRSSGATPETASRRFLSSSTTRRSPQRQSIFDAWKSPKTPAGPGSQKRLVSKAKVLKRLPLTV